LFGRIVTLDALPHPGGACWRFGYAGTQQASVTLQNPEGES